MALRNDGFPQAGGQGRASEERSSAALAKTEGKGNGNDRAPAKQPQSQKQQEPVTGKRAARSILDFMSEPNAQGPPQAVQRPTAERTDKQEAREVPTEVQQEPEEQPRSEPEAKEAIRLPETYSWYASSNDYLVEAQQGQRAPGQWWLFQEEAYAAQASGYLLEVRYDGDLGKAVAFIYDPLTSKVVKWVDRTGHKPYFLTNMELGEDGRPPVDLTRYKSFSNLAVVTKRDPITNRDVKLTKIITNDPLAVKTLRAALAEKGYRVWEADIKYFLNYIYDNQLIPGMPYDVSDNWRQKDWKRSEELEKLIKESFTEDLRDMALEWQYIFEEPSPRVPKVAFDIEVVAPGEGHFPEPKEADMPVMSVSIVDDKGNKSVLLLARPASRFSGRQKVEGEVELFDSERAMLLELLRRLSRYAVVFTFNGDNFDVPYIYNRLINLGVRPEDIPIVFLQDYVTFKGRLHVDLHRVFDIKALQSYAFGNKYREKSLEAVSEALLGQTKREISTFLNDVSLDELAAYNLQDSVLTMGLVTFNNELTWNLLVLLMRISKSGLEEVSRSQVSAWIKSTLYWEHRRRGLLIPSREDIERMIGRQAPRSAAIIKDKKYRGAIVLQPPQGVFFNVIVLDFASLYPSVIRNWNLSYETVDNPYCQKYVEAPEVGHRICMDRRGISSQLVGLLRDFRVKVYKKKAKSKDLSEEERIWYETVQAAMKVYINASYGVFGNEAFALYSLPVAESVTAIGRATLLETLRRASELNLHILYGDTDSLFVWDPPKDALNEIIRYVQEKLGMDLDIDKTFRLVLFSGLKKNYVGFDGDSYIIKGMVAKKSNTPEFIKFETADVMKILGGLQRPEDLEKTLDLLREKVQEIYTKLRRREYTLDQLAISVMMSKDPMEYKKNTPQHVKAALLLINEGVPVTRGDIISFVKTKDKVGVKPVRLARLADVDTTKYLEYVRSAFEQFLLAFGVRWDEMTGVKKLL
ncbi:DNA-directed DNA polymerase I [Acidilobus sp.]|uniref:DNA-directed DNA polymerase I n=1 Tax=Acidilobus sp. TaxID=1872109 RepID=UPI003D019F4B